MYKKHHHFPVASRPLCPVCGKAVYSRGGVHPQCAMIQDDTPSSRKQPVRTPMNQSMLK
jgi:hypothetical protein